MTISTTGDTQDFGDLNFAGSGGGGLSNSQEVLLVVVDNNTALDFITIATTGNSQDFGSLTGNARYNHQCCVESSTRGFLSPGAPLNTINQYKKLHQQEMQLILEI